MDPLIGSAIIGAGSSLLSGAIDAPRTKKNINLQAVHNRELAKYAFDRNMEAWHEMNQYNAPVKQMERLKEAGLNPNLVYGTPNVVGRSGEVPRYQEQATSHMGRGSSLSGVPNALGQYMNARLQKAEIDKAEAIARQEAAKATEAEYRVNPERIAHQYADGSFRIQPYFADRLEQELGFLETRYQGQVINNMIGQTRIDITDLTHVDKINEVEFNKFKRAREEAGFGDTSPLELKMLYNILTDQGDKRVNNYLVYSSIQLGSVIKDLARSLNLRGISRSNQGQGGGRFQKVGETVHKSKSKSGRMETYRKKYEYRPIN